MLGLKLIHISQGAPGNREKLGIFCVSSVCPSFCHGCANWNIMLYWTVLYYVLPPLVNIKFNNISFSFRIRNVYNELVAIGQVSLLFFATLSIMIQNVKVIIPLHNIGRGVGVGGCGYTGKGQGQCRSCRCSCCLYEKGQQQYWYWSCMINRSLFSINWLIDLWIEWWIDQLIDWLIDWLIVFNIVFHSERSYMAIIFYGERFQTLSWNSTDCKVSHHYSDIIMGAMASQITSLTIVYSIIYSGADQRKHQSSASLAFVRGIHRRPVNSPHKGPVMRKMFRFDDNMMDIWWLSARLQYTVH